MDPGYSTQDPDLALLAKTQRDTIRNLARRYTAQGYEISPAQVDAMVRTIMGEAMNEGPAGQQAVGNTMLNRMADGEKFDKMARAYDANGMRHAYTGGDSGVPANAGFENTQPGQGRYSDAISALMRPQSKYSRFANEMPDSIKTAKQYYNPDIASPEWGGSNFQRLGNHAFGNEFKKTSENVMRDRQHSPIFGEAGSVTTDSTLYANEGHDTLNPFDREPQHQAPDPTFAQGWQDSYIPEGDANMITAGLTGKPGEVPGSWGDVFGKFGKASAGIGKTKTASLGPDGVSRPPTTYITEGKTNREIKSAPRPRKPRYRPTKRYFASIMEGVNGPYA